MFISYFKLAVRRLAKARLFTSIKILGLMIALVAAILIGMHSNQELSFDAFHENAHRIARVTMEYHVNGKTIKAGVTGTKVAPAFQRDFPEVREAVRVHARPRVVRPEGKPPREEEAFYYADSTFFEIFSFRMIAGDPETALDGPDQVVISASKARFYFGEENPVGRVLRVENERDYIVTGVMEDPPVASQMIPDFVASFHSLPVAAPERETWWTANYATYLLLAEEGDISKLQAKISPYMSARAEETGLRDGNYLTYNLEPLRSVHLHSEVPGIFVPSGDIRHVYVLALVGLLIVVIGVSIYVNLYIAESANRARQVGIQKVLGATPARLFRQHLAEALLVACAALALSVPTAALLIAPFNRLFERSLSIDTLADPGMLLAVAAAGVGAGLLAGVYPALVLSRQKPSSILMGKYSFSASGVWLRKGLVVVQFVISAGLIICAIILQKQMEFIQSRDLGYNKEHVIVVRMDRQTIDRVDALRNEFKQHPQVRSASVAYETPTYIQGGYSIAPSIGDEQGTPVTALPADEHFLSTFDIPLVAGRGFTAADIELVRRIDEQDDTTTALPILINESQAGAFGWPPDEAVGHLVSFQGKAEVRGVIQDFHFASLHEPIGNLVIFPSPWGNSLMVKLDGRELPSTLAFIESRWTEFVGHRPFTYHFLDDEFDRMYGAELRMTRMARTFAGVAILLACLGLFGLASFSIAQRTKEIGIRKVLGATIPGLVGFLSVDYLKLVVVALVIAVPVTYLTMRGWLNEFAYRTEMSVWIFAAAGAAAILIALLTISYQAIRTALANPVTSLRHE